MGNSMLRKLAALAAGVATLAIGGVAVSTANAAAVTPGSVDKDKTISLTATKGAFDGKGGNLKAYLLASYKSATDDGAGHLKSVELDTTDEIADKIKDAIKKTTYTAADGKTTVTMSVKDNANPMNDVAALTGDGDGSVAWASQLRQFATQINLQDLSALDGTSPKKSFTGTASADGTTFNFTGLIPGYYLVKDTTPAGDSAAIPMIVGTTAGGLSFNNGVNLGEVAYKSIDDTPNPDGKDPNVQRPTKSADTNAAKVGEVIHYTVKQVVPNTTGYPGYVLRFTDTMGAGLTFNNDIKVSVDTVGDLTKDTDYEIVNTGLADGATFRVNFGTQVKGVADINGDGKTDDKDVIRSIAPAHTDKFPIGATVTITYSATVNAHANEAGAGRNDGKTEYSNNPNAWWKQFGSSTTKNEQDKPYPDNVYATAGVWSTKGKTATVVPGAVIAVKDGGTTVGFVPTADGTGLIPASDKSAKGYVEQISMTSGKVNLSLLNNKKYEIVVVNSPSGYSSTDKADFEVVASKQEDGTYTVTLPEGGKNNGNHAFTGNGLPAGTVGFENIATLAGLPLTGGTGAFGLAILAGIVLAVSVVLARRASANDAALHAATPSAV